MEGMVDGEGERVSTDVVGIERLPDALLCHILSFMETRYAVQTSLLSKHWRYLWTYVPCIDLRFCRNITSFIDFLDRVLHLNTVSCLRKLRLVMWMWINYKRLDEWISTAMEQRDIEELDLDFAVYAYQHCAKLPPRTFTSEKLVILKLNHGILLDVPASVYLPSLKILHLRLGKLFDKDSMMNLLDGCLVLEELNFIEVVEDDWLKPLIVSSSTLKTLIINYRGFNEQRIVVDVPNVERLDLLGNMEAQYDIRSLDSLVKVDIRTREDFLINRLVKLLGKITNTQYLRLCSATLHHNVTINSLDDVPMFHKLTHLVLDNFDHCWRVLPALLESSPNLVTFVSHKGQCHCEEQLQFKAPKCLMLYLEEIKLSNFKGFTFEMDMVSYFLNNATVLKKLSIQCYYPCYNYSEISKKLLTFVGVSPECEITFV